MCCVPAFLHAHSLRPSAFVHLRHHSHNHEENVVNEERCAEPATQLELEEGRGHQGQGQVDEQCEDEHLLERGELDLQQDVLSSECHSGKLW